MSCPGNSKGEGGLLLVSSVDFCVEIRQVVVEKLRKGLTTLYLRNCVQGLTNSS